VEIVVHSKNSDSIKISKEIVSFQQARVGIPNLENDSVGLPETDKEIRLERT